MVIELATQRIDAARFSFLDLDDLAEIESESPAARGIDLKPAAPVSAVPSSTLELEI